MEEKAIRISEFVPSRGYQQYILDVLAELVSRGKDYEITFTLKPQEEEKQAG